MGSEDRPSQPNRLQIYEPVQEPDEIRVLRLASGTTSDKEVDCELFVTSLPPLRRSPSRDSVIESTSAPSSPTATSSKAARHLAPEKSSRKTVSYEAMSWCWGPGKETRKIRVKRNGRAYEFMVSPLLEDALKALRLKDQDRYLWIDAICIDQANLEERNSQVPKMDRIYGGATNVCIWIGQSYENSDDAIDFISNKILNVWDFDRLCQDELETNSWGALINLMRRDWFSRRWVVQEIALAKRGTLHCGNKCIDWQDFADAVSLFVHVETATHLLSDVMRRDRFFGHRPDYFGDVSKLGAALLVDATRNLFRESPSRDGKRYPRLSLESLISKYSVFEASQPRDTIYAFLSIAKDTKAQTSYDESTHLQDPKIKEIQEGLAKLPKAQQILQHWGRRMTAMKAFEVDYASPVEAVYRDFIKFSIQRSMETDPTRPLDIICRPWAPAVRPGDDAAGISYLGEKGEAKFRLKTSRADDIPKPLPSWIPNVNQAAFTMISNPALGPRMERINADPLVGLPSLGERNYSAAGTRVLSTSKLRFKVCGKHNDAFAMCVEGFILDEVDRITDASSLGNIPSKWPSFAGWTRWNKESDKVPEAFWRTLVADRGPLGQNALTFYPRACREALRPTLAKSIPFETKEMINHGQCTIIAEFLRRVQAVIWNRRMMYTKYGDHLGLIPEHAKEGDLICILYGCSVPVLVRRHVKDDKDIAQDYCKAIREAADLIKRNWKKRADLRERLRNLQQAVHPLPQFSTSSTRTGTTTTISPDNSSRDPISLASLTGERKTRSSELPEVMTSTLAKIRSYLQISWVTIALFYLVIRLISLSIEQGEDTWSPAFMVHRIVRARLYFDLVHLLLIVPLLLVLLSYIPLSEVRPSTERLKVEHSLRVKGDAVDSDGSTTNRARDSHKLGGRAAKSRKTPSAKTKPKFPPLGSQEWIEEVDRRIKDGFELPWSQLDRTKFDETRIVKEAKEDERCYYTLVGECYVHQMMDGEAIELQASDTVDERERKRRKPKVFELR